MKTNTYTYAIMLAWVLSIAGATAARAAEIKLLASGGFRAAYLELVPGFERASGHKVVSTFNRAVRAQGHCRHDETQKQKGGMTPM